MMRKLEVALALYRLLDALGEGRTDAGDRGHILDRRLTHRAHAPEPPQERALPRRTHSVDIVEDAPDGPLPAHLLVVGDREPMGLVADPLDQIEALGRPREDDRVGPARHKELFALLGQRRDRDLQEAGIGQGRLPGGELALAPVEHHEVGDRPAFSVRGRALEAAAQRVAHVREVVVAVGDLRAEAPIRVLRRTAILEYDHRAHDARALDVAHVVALDPFRRTLEAERVRELPKRGVGLAAVGEPPHSLLFEGVAGIALGELCEVTLLSALGNEDADGAAAPLRRECFELALVRDRNGNDYLRRERGRDGVVLPKERSENVRHACAFGTLEREVIAAHHRGVANPEDLYDRITFAAGGRGAVA